MSGRKNENASDTFGKYTGSGSSAGTKKADGPKNITADMWAPISAGKAPEKKEQTVKKAPSAAKAPTKKTQKKPQKKSPPAEQKTKKSAPPISEGRTGSFHTDKPAPSKKKKKSRVPKGRPVSELAASADERLSKAMELREQRERHKADRYYDDEIKGGKSPGEISKARAAKKRKKRIRRNIAITVLFIVFVFAFLGVYIFAKGTPIANVTVEGESIYTSKQIIEASGVEKGANMFAVSEEKVNNAVCAELPYIHSVNVRRKLPDSVIITVTPTTDRYLIVNGKEYICVDGYGTVVSHEVKKLQDGFFRIKGFEKQDCPIGTVYEPSEANAARFELVKSIVTATDSHEIIKRGVINISDMRNVRLYCNGVMVYLGSCFDIERQIIDVANILNSQFADGETGYINAKTKVPAFQKGTLKAD